MLIVVGALVIAVTVYLMVKQYETRLILFCAGMFLAICAASCGVWSVKVPINQRDLWPCPNAWTLPTSRTKGTRALTAADRMRSLETPDSAAGAAGARLLSSVTGSTNFAPVE